MLFMMISKHAPEACPVFNSQTRAVFLNYFEKAESLAHKYGIKQVGMWVDHPGHTGYMVFEAPSFEAFMGFSMEPEVEATLGASSSRMFPVFTAQETYTMIKQGK